MLGEGLGGLWIGVLGSGLEMELELMWALKFVPEWARAWQLGLKLALALEAAACVGLKAGGQSS
jgi:hypothetical protein